MATSISEVVREQATIYGRSNYTPRGKTAFTPHDQDVLIFCLIGIILEAFVF